MAKRVARIAREPPMKHEHAISPTRTEDYPSWYQEVVRAADLAEPSPVRGCMVIKPWGYAIWENIQRALDDMFKATGHENAYFPLFIPKSFLEKEAEHVEGFAKECAVVTHHRLEAGPDGGLVPAGPLEEPLIVRPTSETIIGSMFSKWVQSYRDLPILLNQWANVVRWELRTRLFLRTTEFLWQEGHTVHATSTEALEETMQMLEVYRRFAEDWMAMPVICGEKTSSERFPGAVSTFAIEALMQDRKALQAGTSHFLGQSFAKAQQIRYLSAEGQLEHAWTTSWGVSTRLIGGLVMTHSDDDGLVIPPRLAPVHVVILPIHGASVEPGRVDAHCDALAASLRERSYCGAPVRVKIDRRDMRGGDKLWEHIKKGVPIRLEVGPRDIASDSVFMARRDRPPREKASVPREAFVATVDQRLAEIQRGLFERARAFRDAATTEVSSLEEFRARFTGDERGMVRCHAADVPDYAAILEELKVSARCMPLDDDSRGTCIFTGRPDARRVVFAQAY
jgi:prolyl-tRNA synthetase